MTRRGTTAHHITVEQIAVVRRLLRMRQNGLLEPIWIDSARIRMGPRYDEAVPVSWPEAKELVQQGRDVSEAGYGTAWRAEAGLPRCSSVCR